ncbi:hypothetical protein CDAR_242351 [Caerostris darwini]|uniref:Uncharacterized protein n=1 Tax=Caerostris darwini TaxID=1538125 RepID=A0AAV4RUH4_9ARAC|nr:hypothetical protein CDAR_242351 [Caerostris darwini]
MHCFSPGNVDSLKKFRRRFPGSNAAASTGQTLETVSKFQDEDRSENIPKARSLRGRLPIKIRSPAL